MNRRSLAGFIMVVWVGALLWLGYRELGAGQSNLADDDLRTVPPGAAYYVVSLGDDVVGYAAHTIDTVPEGILVDDRLTVEIPVNGGVTRSHQRTVANLSNAFRLRDFETTVGSEHGEFVTSGSVAGDSMLSLQLTTPNATYTAATNVRGTPLILQAYLPMQLAFREALSETDTLSLSQFDPVLWHSDAIDLQVLAESTLTFPDSAVWDSSSNIWVPARWDTLQAWRIRQSTQGQQSELWIDELGQLVSVRNNSGFNIMRTAFEIAFHNFRNRETGGGVLDPFNTVPETPIAAGITTLDNELAELRLAVESDHLQSESSTDARQQLSGDTVIIRREEGEALRSTLRLPASPDGPNAEYLVGDPVLQAGDPRIQARARLIIDGTRNASRATRRLVNWVHERLLKRPAVGIPSALGVLESEQGDSYEHAILFIALARAVGLPTRPAAGLLFVDGRFYYHVWAEVNLGSGWVAVDPAFGQFPADAAHVRFANHLPAGDIEMVQLIGRPSIDVVSDQE